MTHKSMFAYPILQVQTVDNGDGDDAIIFAEPAPLLGDVPVSCETAAKRLMDGALFVYIDATLREEMERVWRHRRVIVSGEGNPLALSVGRAAFIRELAGQIVQGMIDDIDKVPENWRGAELRQWLADRMTEQSWSNLDDGRDRQTREYRNDRMVNNI